MERVETYINTIRFMRPIQVITRVRFVFYSKVLHRLNIYKDHFKKLDGASKPYSVIEFPYILPYKMSYADLLGGNFNFLNKSSSYEFPIDWHPESQTKLWKYNLHYFDFIRPILFEYQNSKDPGCYILFRQLVKDWIKANPVAQSISWDSYPISLRVVNWLRAYCIFKEELEKDETFSRELRDSLFMQGNFLESHIEYHLLNNHLLENGKTLWLIGNFFQGPKSEKWKRRGFSILMQGLSASILPDGGHDERSPMYHQIMLEMYQEIRDILFLRGEDIPEKLTSSLDAMKRWLGAMLHPDGKFSLFNDSAFDVAAFNSDTLSGHHPESDRLTFLSDTGYSVIRDAQKKHALFFNCGSMGPAHNAGHGHCDALSFELSLFGKRILVDSGVDDYDGEISTRDFYRSTRAHNTVVVNGQNQSEIWGRYRVARRCKIKKVENTQTQSLVSVAASHDGYRRLAPALTHRRWICYVDNRFWVVCDKISGASNVSAESLLHFHPEVEILSAPSATDFGFHSEVGRGENTLAIDAWGLHNLSEYKGDTSPLNGLYCSRFGTPEKNIVWGFNGRITAPAWFGFVLWPNGRPTNIEYAADNEAAKITIESVSQAYTLRFSGDESVTLTANVSN